ncbi:MAG TPA: MBL fold metallo-hydrolase [Geomonas sp.]|nr:MBL fold metallo-hydrolase [Geomonas sp.]
MRQHTVMTPYVVGEVHYYSTEIDGELVLFDTGPPTPEAIAELERSVDLKRLKYLFVTHCHVDHDGLAAYVEQHSDARIFFPRKDVLKLGRSDEWAEGFRSLLAAAGFPVELSRRLLGSYHKPHRYPQHYEVAEECDAAERLGITVIDCSGHSQSDLVYLLKGFAVTGDILLRDIFQSSELTPRAEDPSTRFNNYRAYCESIPKMAGMRGLNVLPAHRYSIEGVDQTILFYIRKLLERARLVKRFAEVEKVSEVVERIFGNSLVDPVITYIKASEIYFMRDFLADPEPLRSALEQVGLFNEVSELYLSTLE